MKTTTDDYRKALDLFARIMRYPNGAEYGSVIDQAVTAFTDDIDKKDGVMSKSLAVFAQVIKAMSTPETEELFTHTFDLNPACALETGWHLFGESYDRGTYLVWMRQQLRDYHLEESAGDLPDHVSYAIRILARMEQEKAGQFSQLCLLPSIQRIVDGFKEKEKRKENPYRALLKAFGIFLIDKYGTAGDTTTVPLPVLKQHEELFSLEGV